MTSFALEIALQTENPSYHWGSTVLGNLSGSVAIWWNARAAFPAQFNRQKETYLHRLLHKQSLTGIVECHGTSRQIRHRLRRFLRTFKIKHYPAYRDDGRPSLSAGGVLILIPKRMQALSFAEKIFVQGYAVKVIIGTSRGTVVMYTVHCHKFSKQTLDSIATELRTDIAKARNDPYGYIVLLGGDFNYNFPGDKKFIVSGENLPQGTRCESSNSSAHEVPCEFRQFHESVQLMTEVSDSRPTFYRHAHRSEYRLDRVFWSLPPIVSRFSYVSGGTIGSPYGNWRAKISDHSAVSLTIRSDGHHSHDCPRPIPPWITRNPAFKRNLDSLVQKSEILCWERSDLDPMVVEHRDSSEDLRTLNILIRKVAATTRNQLLSEADAASDINMHASATDLLLTSIAPC